MIDRRPADDANWDGLPGTSRRRLISSLLLALALVAGIALAIYGGLTGPTDSHPAPNAEVVHLISFRLAVPAGSARS